MILVFGATGKTGSEIIKKLLARSASIRVLIRDADKAAYFKEKGIDVVIGDANDIAAVTLALTGVTKVYLVLANSQHQLEQEKLITDCAKKSAVKLLVKQSSLETMIYPNNPIPKAHLESEQYIKSSGLNWVIIRPTFFNQMLLMCAYNIKANDTLIFPMANGCVAATDVRDVAEIAATVLTESGHNNKTYDISGTEFLSFNTIAAIFSKILNRQITYVSQSLSEYRKMLETRLNDEWRINAVCEELNSLSTCSVNYVSRDNIQRILGRPARSVEQFVEDYKEAFVKE
ncbi:NmrA family NAD(P)-binding protein [Pseudocolwellia sp. AS88]|uniref:NmrA family NAD(P)-binding protein n=1 Tax=Pseudocolwellia sp. AS88 TaxID=3063958 RepID=UPI0026EC5B23|nr:NmrA family NAD(P)-binding protein [Pseudocolwellia sp. AS88]MDO7085329.1 NmrA family NAD(P)-binding protein [Pseudocolwellia sp. AS88]